MIVHGIPSPMKGSTDAHQRVVSPLDAYSRAFSPESTAGRQHGGMNMVRSRRLFETILRGTSDAAIPFHGLCQLMNRLGFKERIRGSHHIFVRPDIEEILNFQPKGSLAKPYQVKLLRAVILKYRLTGEVEK